MSSKVLKIFMFLFVILFVTSSFAEEADTKQQSHFLILTDIHFDPFIACYKNNPQPCPLIKKLQNAPANQWAAILNANDTKSSAYRQDTNYRLLVSALQSAKQTAETKHVHFVLVLGDMLGHDFRRYYKRYAQDKSRAGYQSFVNKTLIFLSNEIARTFPTLDVYSLVGNNDSYHGDYYCSPNGQFYRDMASVWSGLIKTSGNRTLMRQEFPVGGYYAFNVPEQPDMRIIMLNTVLFSTKARGKNLDEAAKREFDWLHQQLVMAKEKKQHVLIGMHIPEGIDVYSSLRIPMFRVIEFWYPEYTKLFQAELKQFAGEISGIFAGHLHADWFQVQRFDDLNEIPVLGTPAISPLFGNNPGFKIYSYSNQTGKIVDFVTYYYPLNTQTAWKTEYSFTQVYKPHCRECTVTMGMDALKPTGVLADFYKLFYAVQTTSQPITTKWNPYYWCAIREVNAVNYEKCVA